LAAGFFLEMKASSSSLESTTCGGKRPRTQSRGLAIRGYACSSSLSRGVACGLGGTCFAAGFLGGGFLAGAAVAFRLGAGELDLAGSFFPSFLNTRAASSYSMREDNVDSERAVESRCS
jgi:hypothetical protein